MNARIIAAVLCLIMPAGFVVGVFTDMGAEQLAAFFVSWAVFSAVGLLIDYFENRR